MKRCKHGEKTANKDVAYKQGLCSVEIHGCKPCFRSPGRKSATKFKVVTENLLLRGEIKIFRCFSFCLFFVSTFKLILSDRFLTGSWWSNGSIQDLHCYSQKTDEYLGACYLPICAKALSRVCFTHCKPLSARSEWQAYNLDCILMLLPYAAKHSVDSWGTVGRSGRKGDIEFYAPVSAASGTIPTQDGASWVSSNWCRLVQKQVQSWGSVF